MFLLVGNGIFNRSINGSIAKRETHILLKQSSVNDSAKLNKLFGFDWKREDLNTFIACHF